jgi:gluconolactonase
MKSTTSVTILATGLAFPEGPAFDSVGALWCVELKGGSLVRFAQGRLERIPCDGEPNGIAIGSRDEIWFCDAGLCAVRRYTPATGRFDTLASHVNGESLAKPNDLSFDAAGNLVFTCPGESQTAPTGYVCCLGRDGSVKKIAGGMYFPNGLVFVDGGATLIIAETRRQRLWRGRWDAATAAWREPRPWADVGGRVGPDGMAAGRDGLVYVAVYSAGQVKAVAPDGTITRVFDVPGVNPTNCAFDPSGQLGLVVTEAEKGLLLSLTGLGPGLPLFAPNGTLRPVGPMSP